MPRYMLNGKAVKMNGKFVQYNNSVLSFQVSGDTFPKSIYASGGNFTNTQFKITSSEANSSTINLGDGNTKSYTFKSNLLQFKPSVPLGDSLNQEIHTYTDSNSGTRIIRISFSKPEKITALQLDFITISGVFPNEIGALVNLNYLKIVTANFTSFPPSFSTLINLKTLILIGIGTAISLRLPDEFLTLALESLEVSSSINFSDASSSNLINLFNSSNKNTLKNLAIDGCNITTLPDNISNLTSLLVLRIGGNNPYTTLPYQVNTLTSLAILDVGTYYGSGTTMTTWTSLSNLVNLTQLVCIARPNLETNLPAGLESCAKLKVYNVNGTYNTTARVNAFITNFYNFINTNAAKSGVSTLPFRGITLNITGGSPTGVFQQPTGYVTGSNNGSPASPKEMLWLLQNQYLHTLIYTS